MTLSATTTKPMKEPIIDPVCRIKVNVNELDLMATYQGQDYFFCAEVCRREFESNPRRYREPMSGRSKEPKTWWGRYLKRVAKANEKLFGGRPHCCH